MGSAKENLSTFFGWEMSKGMPGLLGFGGGSLWGAAEWCCLVPNLFQLCIRGAGKAVGVEKTENIFCRSHLIYTSILQLCFLIHNFWL